MLDILEQYLKDEGLYSVILEHRRRSLFRLPVAAIWFIFTWGLSCLMVVNSRGSQGLIVAILIPSILFIVIIALFVVFYIIRQFRTGQKLSSQNAGPIGLFLIFVLPLLTAIALGIYLSTWLGAIVYIGIYVSGLIIVLFMQMQVYRIHLLIESMRSVFRALRRSLALLLVLIPLLLIVVVLSVFSQELWQALATLSATRLIGSMACLIAPALVLVAASLDRETKAVVGIFPDKQQIIERAENTGFVKDKLDKGLISQEEWDKLQKQLEWRSMDWLIGNLIQPVLTKTKRWLVLSQAEIDG